ncbi:MAG: hypothetical protein Q7T81_10935 [Pseudolabrys sp.]|nr:hypothetical protein [Pseudolabrys sp.]
MRILIAVLAAGFCTACTTTETVQFKAQADQQSIIRDGQAALVSRKKKSVVIARPASRQFQIGGRPVFVLAINNLTKTPENFLVSNVQVTQVVRDEAVPLKVITYEMLVQEEKTRQVFAAVATGLSAGANAYSASRAGYYNANSTVYTPRGAYQVHTTGYSPTAAAIAQSNASAQNAEMINATIERGQQNLAMLEQGVIKDNTLMPGEWYGGQLHIAPLASDEGPAKNYTIAVVVGGERHEINVAQGTVQ